MLDVVVDRKRWDRGMDHLGNVYLLGPRGMCCLGFACLAAGLTAEDIQQISIPAFARSKPLPDSLKLLVDRTGNRNSLICQRLTGANDRLGTVDYPEAKREADIIKLGKEAGLNFTFEN